MKYIFITFLIFCFGSAYSVSHKIEYSDSDKTYLQVSIFDTTAMKYISGILKFSNASQDKSDKTALFSIEVDSNSITKIVEIKSDSYRIDLFEAIRYSKIEIIANKLNKLTLFVEQGRLKFSYQDHPELPIELNAIIKLKLDKKIEYSQPTNEIRHYPSGRYYVEINTVPLSKHTIDMDYGLTYEIQIRIPGRLTLKMAKGVTNIEVSSQLFNRNKIIDHIKWDESFYPLSILTDTYKISWDKDGKHKEAFFKIISNKLTEFICD